MPVGLLVATTPAGAPPCAMGSGPLATAGASRTWVVSFRRQAASSMVLVTSEASSRVARIRVAYSPSGRPKRRSSSINASTHVAPSRTVPPIAAMYSRCFADARACAFDLAGSGLGAGGDHVERGDLRAAVRSRSWTGRRRGADASPGAGR